MQKVLGIVFGVALLASPVYATPPAQQAGELVTSGTSRTLVLPEPAFGSPVISLGVSVDPASGKNVEGYAIIHYKKGFHHRNGHSGGPGGGGTSTCYAFLAKDAKWKTVEPWVVNAANTRGLDGAFVAGNLADDIAKWEDAADGTVGNGGSVNILGDGSTTTSTLIADTATPDNVNEVYFADIAEEGAIGVTIVWGIFGGPPFGRELVEWDQVYDDVDFDWSSSGEASKMDFENIATHELGHSVGLSDLYEVTCAEETMYGFATEGETKKRDLNTGDIAGVSKLY